MRDIVNLESEPQSEPPSIFRLEGAHLGTIALEVAVGQREMVLKRHRRMARETEGGEVVCEGVVDVVAQLSVPVAVV